VIEDLLADAEATKLGKLLTAGAPMHSLAVCGQSGGQDTQQCARFSEKTNDTGEVVALALRLGNDCGAIAFATRRLIQVLERFR
jgi:hypothetical protein